MANDRADGQDQEPTDLMLAREIRKLDAEIQPTRDLWPSIERNISQTPQRRKTEFGNNWMPYAVAASLVIAISSLMLSTVDRNQPSSLLMPASYTIDSVSAGYLKVRNPLVEQFADTNKHLAPETLDDLYRNIEIIEAARRDIELQVRQNPENTRLVEMLMRLHRQEIDLLKQDYSQAGLSL